MVNQRYDTPEKLSGTDAEVIQWRRLVVTKHYGGRDAAFEYQQPRTASIPTRCRSSASPSGTFRRRCAPRRGPGRGADAG